MRISYILMSHTTVHPYNTPLTYTLAVPLFLVFLLLRYPIPPALAYLPGSITNNLCYNLILVTGMHGWFNYTNKAYTYFKKEAYVDQWRKMSDLSSEEGLTQVQHTLSTHPLNMHKQNTFSTCTYTYTYNTPS